MKIVINQPYFLPYVGLFEKVALADLFVINDFAPINTQNISHRRARLLQHFYDSQTIFINEFVNRQYDGQPFCEVPLGEDFYKRMFEICKTIQVGYARANYYSYLAPELFYNLNRKDFNNLAGFNINLIMFLLERLGVNTKVEVVGKSGLFRLSDFELPQGFLNRGSYGTLLVCERFGATEYISGQSGPNFLETGGFRERGIKVIQHQNSFCYYPQFKLTKDQFVSGLSVLDLLFHLGPMAKGFIGKNSKFTYGS